MDNNRNTFLAIALSILIVIGWQYFFIAPRMEEERRQAEIAAKLEQTKIQASQQDNGQVTTPSADGIPQPQGQTIPGIEPDSNDSQVQAGRDKALSATKRAAIDTESLEGSVSLKGARIDDLRLKNYREALDPDSPLIELLSPSGTNKAYFAEFGFVADKSVGGVPVPDTLWQVKGNATLTEKSPLVLSWTNEKGVEFERTISVDDKYLFTISDKVINHGEQSVTLTPWGRIARFFKPSTQPFFVLHEGLIGYLGEEGLQEVDYSDIEDDKKMSFNNVDQGWLGITDKYWATALIPTDKFNAQISYFDKGKGHYQTHFVGQAATLAANGVLQTKNYLFAGAKETPIINGYNDELGLYKFDFMIDWGWFYFITKPLWSVLHWFYGLFGNFGVAILILTVCVKLLFFPLANMSYASMAKMKKVQPELTQLRERFKDDRAKQQQEMLALYKKEKINPAAGCWPMLIQIPVFFALYKVIFVTIEMRHAPFFGWIQDLSAPDPTSIFNLFGLLPFEVPSMLLVGVWPLLMGITMFLQMRMNPAPPDPTQAIIFNWMPLIFTFMLASFPAGLVIYWAWNNFLTILQQGFIMRRHGVKIELFDNLKSLVGMNKKAS